MIKKVLNVFFSTRLMAVLFIVFAFALAIATFFENEYGTVSARAVFYNSWWFELIMLLFTINFIGNIFRYNLLKKEKWSILVFHTAFIFIFLGAFITRYISFEGVLQVKEGETTNLFASSDTFLQLIVDDGEKERDPIEKKLILSNYQHPLLYTNSFTLNKKFQTQDITIEYVNYIPNAKKDIVKAEDGGVILKLTDASSGARHDHFIKSGEVLSLHGVKIALNKPTDSVININYTDNKMTINSPFEGQRMVMETRSVERVAKDSVQEFHLKSLYTLNNKKFVATEIFTNAKEDYVFSEDADAHPNSLLRLDVTTNGETERVDLFGAKNWVSPYSNFSVGGLNFRARYGAKNYELPFSITLEDFQLEKYPGSEMASSYASEVKVNDTINSSFDYRIFMNTILNYRGYRFFQSHYNITPQGEYSYLAVNHDFWGTLITYIGYVLLFLGLIWTLFNKNSRFRRLSGYVDKIRLKKTELTILVLLMALGAKAQDHPDSVDPQVLEKFAVENAVAEEHATKFGHLLIQDSNGRIKPVNTFASQLLRKIYKKEGYNDLDANQFLMGVIQDPQTWGYTPTLYLGKYNADKIRDIIGIEQHQKYASFADFYDAKGHYKLSDYVNKAQQKLIKSKFEEDIIQVNNRVMILASALGGSGLRFLPVPGAAKDKWVTIYGSKEAFKGQDSLFVTTIFNDYHLSLKLAKKSNDYSEPDDYLEIIGGYQKKMGKEIVPTSKQINLEVLYNKYDIFKKLFSYYMYIGVLLLFLVLVQVFKDTKWLRRLIKGGAVIVTFLFVLHTIGLIVRWYISGHAPWSNAYESMIYLGWATILFGLLFSKKSMMTLAATTFLASMILMIAHWNWMDPEIGTLVPVLNSYWLMIHVAVIVGSYGPFALSMLLGVVCLLLYILTTAKNRDRINLNIKELTAINEMTIIVGIVMLTIGNFLGGMWANESWGRYWGWDSKETWSLISILVYVFVLHTRFVPKIRNRFSFNMLSVISFGSIIMTYFGVNFYLTGLHSYGKSDMAPTPTFIYYTMGVVFVLCMAAFLKFRKYYIKADDDLDSV